MSKTETKDIVEVVETTEKTTVENYEALKATIEALNTDFEKFQDKKVKAAGQRARNSLLNCKKLCDKLRKQILAEIKEIPIKHRITDDETESQDEKEEAPPSPPKLVRQVGEIKETGANGAHESHQPEPKEKPKSKRKRKANKKKLTKEDLKDE